MVAGILWNIMSFMAIAALLILYWVFSDIKGSRDRMKEIPRTIKKFTRWVERLR